MFADSHHEAAYVALSTALRRNPSVNMISFGIMNKCQPQVRSGTLSKMRKISDPACAARIDNLVAVTRKVSVIVWCAIWYYTDRPEIANTIGTIKWMQERNPNIKVLIFGVFYRLKEFTCDSLMERYKNISACTNPKYLLYDPFNPPLSERPRIEYLREYIGARYLNRTFALCANSNGTISKSHCLLTSSAGEPFIYDQNHWNPSFSRDFGLRMGVYQESFKAVGLTLSF